MTTKDLSGCPSLQNFVFVGGGRPKFFQTSTGDLLEVSDYIINACFTIKCLLSGRDNFLFQNSLGSHCMVKGGVLICIKENRILAKLLQNDDERVLIVLHDMKTPVITKLLEFIVLSEAETTEREKRRWQTNFMTGVQPILCDLATAAYFLDNRPLVNLTSRDIAAKLTGKTTEQLREILGTPDEPPEQLVPMNSLPLKWKLHAKLDFKQQMKKAEKLIPAPPPVSEFDDRSVDDILEFLGESNKKSTPKSNHNKGKKKKKGQKGNTTPSNSHPVSSTPTDSTDGAFEDPIEPDSLPQELHFQESPPMSFLLPSNADDAKEPAEAAPITVNAAAEAPTHLNTSDGHISMNFSETISKTPEETPNSRHLRRIRRDSHDSSAYPSSALSLSSSSSNSHSTLSSADPSFKATNSVGTNDSISDEDLSTHLTIQNSKFGHSASGLELSTVDEPMPGFEHLWKSSSDHKHTLDDLLWGTIHSNHFGTFPDDSETNLIPHAATMTMMTAISSANATPIPTTPSTFSAHHLIASPFPEPLEATKLSVSDWDFPPGIVPQRAEPYTPYPHKVSSFRYG